MKCLTLLVAVFAVLLIPASASLRAEEEWMFDPTFRERGPEDVLVAGPPPLLRGQVDAFVDLFEAAFEMALPAPDEQRLRDAWERAYARAPVEERETFAALVAPLTGIRHRARTGDATAVLTGLEAFRRALDQRLTSAPDAAPHPLLADLLRLRQEAAWPGEPLIHRPAADAWLALAEFVVSAARNETVDPTAGQRDQVRRDLAAVLGREPAPIRLRIRDVHRPWLRLKAQWDRSSAGTRLALRWACVDLLNRALPAGERLFLELQGDLRAYAREAAAIRRTQSAYEAWSNLVRHPLPVLDAVAAWLGPAEPEGDAVLLYR